MTSSHIFFGGAALSKTLLQVDKKLLKDWKSILERP